MSVYEVPKETTANPAPASMAANSMSAPQVKWETPAGWQEQPPTGMRAADFQIPNPNGSPASVSIIPMSKLSGARTAIVNMWREEVGLKAVGETESPQTEKVSVGNKDGELYDLMADEAQSQNGDKNRLLVAVLEEGERSWFFKMKGPATLLESQRDAFRQFLKSIRFERGTAATRPAVAARPRPRPAGASEAAHPKWQVPAGWQETPPTSMGLARFLVGEENGTHAEITVTALPGPAGGTLANINRWRVQQLGLEPASESDLATMVKPLDQAGAGAMLVEMSGQNVKGDGRLAVMVAVIVPRDNASWFYKLFGDPALVEREKKPFVSFVQSVDYADGF